MKIDEDALEKAYNEGLKCEKAGDYEGAAKAYHTALAIDPEDHGGVIVRLASIGKAATPSTAPKAYVATLFDQTADVFDMILVDQLGYDVPNLMRERIESLGLNHFDRLLDLGCGTGLVGEALYDQTSHRIGVDLSENMIAIAHEKGDYDQLFIADAESYLKENYIQSWSLITAADVLPYMGELSAFMASIAKCLEKDGIFIFSSETQTKAMFNDCNFIVGPYQRFAHTQSYVRKLLIENKMNLLAVDPIIVRAEQGKPVEGHLYVAQLTA